MNSTTGTYSHSREYGTTTSVDFSRLGWPPIVYTIGSFVLQGLRAMRDIIVRDFPSPI